jgi:chemotaxis protein methyltransferase WspC
MNRAPIADLLEERIGLDVASLGNATLRAAVDERMCALQIAEASAYANCLAAQTDEFEWLVNRLLVPETWFFRGGELFQFLASEIAGRIGVQRILCLPCSTGEEPYSLAIVLQDAAVPRERWRIDGVDLSRRCIEAATRGIYREFSFRQTPPELRARYFRPAGPEWSLDSSIQDVVQFHVGNLVDPTLLGGATFDVILCRNLLIYLTTQARLKAITNLERLLSPDGILGVGHAEPQILASRGYQRFGPDPCFLYRRDSGTRRAPPPSLATSKGTREKAPVRRRQSPKLSATSAVQKEPNTAALAPSLSHARQMADEGRLDDALVVCRNHLTQIGPSADAFSLLGIIHQALGQTSDASDAFRKALYLNPDHHEALTHAMLLSSRIGDETRTAALRDRLTRIGAGGEQ